MNSVVYTYIIKDYMIFFNLEGFLRATQYCNNLKVENLSTQNAILITKFTVSLSCTFWNNAIVFESS